MRITLGYKENHGMGTKRSQFNFNRKEKKMNGVDREGSMWQVLNVITPSEKKRFRENTPEFVLPLTDERINTIFPKSEKSKKEEIKDKSDSKKD